MLKKIKYRVYDILVETKDGETGDRIIAILLMFLILVNTIAVVLETVDDLNLRYGHIFQIIEAVSVTVFIIEYLLRLWVAPMNPQYAGKFGRLKYSVSVMALIDLISILPTLLPMLIPMDLRFIRFLRTFRLFRLLKLGRHIEALTAIDDVVRSKKEEFFITLVMIAMLLLFSSSLMYLVENDAQPDKFPDIPSAMWWGIATLTTVGYGDIFPITPLGKLLGGFIALLGIGMFALPAGILASGFAEELAKRRTAKTVCLCPHCGKDITENA